MTLRQLFASMMFAGAMLSVFGAESAASAKDSALSTSGLPIPRYVSLKSDHVNVRAGPTKDNDVAWVYTKAGLPVEITAEFDIWRKIRDFDGTEGWVQQNLLSGSRTGLVQPWKKDADVSLLASAADTAAVRAYLGSGYRVDIRRCDGNWCQVDAPAKGTTYSGYVRQSDLWGVYQGETF